MAEVQKSCVICSGEESEGELLVAAPCGRHHVCPDDVPSFFERATQNESLFPPKCCGQMFMLQDYKEYVPFDVAWAFQVKEQGEYAVLAKFRVYCGNPSCGKFLHPSSHVTDPESNITYAICEDGACGKLTCTGCKNLLDQGTQNHVCKKNENEEKFKQTAKEKGYQECTVCGATIELSEACNHISCECGNDFCYICGKPWPGLHGCPHYGPATYDEEGYNQDGYHRDTGLNREGLTRRQDIMRRRGDDHEDEEDEEDEEDDGEEDDPDWEVLQHLQPDQRVLVNTLNGEDREDALDQLRITLFETQGIMFGQNPPPPPPPPAGEEDDEEGDEQEDEGEDNDENKDPMTGGALGGAEGDADELTDDELPDIVDNEDVMGGNPDDDGDVFIDEDAMQGDRFADDQSADEGLNDPDHQDAFVDDMYGPLNSFDADHPVWTFEGVGGNNSDDDRESDVPNLGSESGEQLQDRLDKDFASDNVDASAAIPPTNPFPPLQLPPNDAWNQFVQELQNDGYNLHQPLHPNPISEGLFAARSSASNVSNAGSDAQARLNTDFGVAPREPASGSSQGSPATAEGTASPATPMALDEVAEAEKKTVLGPPGSWPEEDEEL